MTLDSRLLSIEQAAHYLGVSARTVRNWVADEHLHPVRLGRRVLLDKKVLDRFIAEHTQGSGPSARSEE